MWSCRNRPSSTAPSSGWLHATPALGLRRQKITIYAWWSALSKVSASDIAAAVRSRKPPACSTPRLTSFGAQAQMRVARIDFVCESLMMPGRLSLASSAASSLRSDAAAQAMVSEAQATATPSASGGCVNLRDAYERSCDEAPNGLGALFRSTPGASSTTLRHQGFVGRNACRIRPASPPVLPPASGSASSSFRIAGALLLGMVYPLQTRSSGSPSACLSAPPGRRTRWPRNPARFRRPSARPAIRAAQASRHVARQRAQLAGFDICPIEDGRFVKHHLHLALPAMISEGAEPCRARASLCRSAANE